MKALSVGQVAEWCGGELVCGSADMQIKSVSTDTRTVGHGEAFLALKGEHFDGHQFLGQAAGAGAVCWIVESPHSLPEKEPGIACIRVGDTLEALQSLARSYRQSLKVRVVGITGSNGKTSTKEMVASALGSQCRVQKTTGNLNNHIGVPLTLLSLEEETEWAVVEMGMNHAGEIRPLAEMAAPDIGIITGIGWAHIEFFESRDGIAEEKGQLFRALGKNATAIFNGDDPYLQNVEAWTEARQVRCGFDSACEYRMSGLRSEEGGISFRLQSDGEIDEQVHLPLFGKPMARNAALALAAAGEAGVSLEQASLALRSLKLPSGRLDVSPFADGWLIDDTYNASPDSVAAAMESLDLLPGEGRKVVLLGGMAELGGRSRELHEWIGQKAVEQGVELMFALGPDVEATVRAAVQAGADANGFVVASDHEEMVSRFGKARQSGDRILVKGSRAMKMETVVKQLRDTLKDTPKEMV